MTNSILSDSTVLYYALKVNGRIVSRPVSERMILEQQRQSLPVNERNIAEIVTVTPEGSELLLG